MIINSSTVAMSSNRSYSSIRQEEQVSVQERNGTASVTLNISQESKNMMEQIKAYKEQQKEKEQENQKRQIDNLRDSARRHVGGADGKNGQFEVREDPKLQMLRTLLESFRKAFGRGKYVKNNSFDYLEKALRASSRTLELQGSLTLKGNDVVDMGSGAGSRTVSNVSTMTRTTVTSGFFAETEHTAYEAKGVAKTADGREISFGVTVEMSRGFCERYETLTQETLTLCDPLVINLDSNTASVSDMKFLFDLDADGEEEEMSFAGKGSGFIALDKNGDGKINDGSELFGTKSGDGFADLAAYDEDGNGWIDEADSIYKDLRVWTKDEKGNDILIDLKSADVGALYLGNASTEFSLNNMETNKTNAVIRSTGVYLKESGGIGTMQHVDLAV
ncbi:MAG: hypothetical protein NC393_08905 [Clostridium sp.]|nr:hypothetical protein [Clostridium sp.]MCM1172230.1 hypothetical protein [Clostridium sp.]MCM1209270.1 hypothetical protein [Ruminococcus sp.]